MRGRPRHSPPGDPALTISIVMPTYRRPHTLYRTIDTILAQTHERWQLVVIDNAGDGGYRFADRRIEVHVHAERPSASYARNQGLRYAHGLLVCFFDDDDDMCPDYLRSFVAAFRAHPGAKLVRCGLAGCDGSVNFSYATPLCCLWRRFATPSWDGAGSCEDQRYFRRIVKAQGWTRKAGEVVVIDKVLCRANCDPRGGLRSGSW
jgi:glycosyltransferase involved in cell wall biosynthesis